MEGGSVKPSPNINAIVPGEITDADASYWYSFGSSLANHWQVRELRRRELAIARMRMLLGPATDSKLLQLETEFKEGADFCTGTLSSLIEHHIDKLLRGET